MIERGVTLRDRRTGELVTATVVHESGWAVGPCDCCGEPSGDLRWKSFAAGRYPYKMPGTGAYVCHLCDDER